MTDRELIQKLNILKVKPDSAWKNRSREILLSQISGGNEISKKVKILEQLDVWSEVFIPFDLLHKLAAKPVMVTGLVIASLLGGGVFSLQAAKNTKPGDSLYIAKIISEKTQLAITFDEKEKAKLGVEFAGNRAKELAQVMEEETDGSAKTEKVEKLAADFNKEITSAKARLEKIHISGAVLPENSADNPADSNPAAGGNETTADSPDMIVGANIGKTNNGIQVSDPKNTAPVKTGSADSAVKAGSGDAKDGGENTGKATSAPENGDGKTADKTPVNILDDAQKLFEDKNYGGAAQKLEEMKNIIDQSGGNGDENKSDTSMNDSATSTDEKVEMSSK
jgi:hypothetical protein